MINCCLIVGGLCFLLDGTKCFLLNWPPRLACLHAAGGRHPDADDDRDNKTFWWQICPGDLLHALLPLHRPPLLLHLPGPASHPAARICSPLPGVVLRGSHLPGSRARALPPLLPPPLPPPPPLPDPTGPQALQHQHAQAEGEGADGDLQGVLLQPLNQGRQQHCRAEVILVKCKRSQKIKPVDSTTKRKQEVSPTAIFFKFRISEILQFVKKCPNPD